MWKTIYNFTLSQSSRSNCLTFSICEARFVLSFWWFCHVSASHRCFPSRKVSTFSPHPTPTVSLSLGSCPWTTLTRSGRKSKERTPPFPSPTLASKYPPSFQTGTSNHRHVSAPVTPNYCMDLFWNLSKKRNWNCRLNFCPHRTDFIRKPTWISLPSFWWICTQRQQLNLMHGNQLGLLNIKAHQEASPALQPEPHLTLYAASLTDSFHLDSQTSLLSWFSTHN